MKRGVVGVVPAVVTGKTMEKNKISLYCIQNMYIYICIYIHISI